MAEESGGPRPPLDQARQMTIDALCEHFANDVMDVDEFERRVDAAHQAATSDDLKRLLQDLPSDNLPAVAGAGQLPMEPPSFSVSATANQKDKEYVVALFGGTGRKGRWTPARSNYAVAVCGGTELDFRDAVMAPGVTDVKVFTMFGGVEIIVPPGLHVESHGIALLGGFEHVADNIHAADPRAPTLRITGVALMGGVDISVRHQGETARDARRRRRIERREQRRLRRGH